MKYMNRLTVVVRLILAVSSLFGVLINWWSFFGNANMLTLAQFYNPYLPTHGTLNVGPPQKETFPLDLLQMPVILSDVKKQQLIHDNHRNTPLPSSGESIQGPLPENQNTLSNK